MNADRLALVMTGGGARAAYQVGCLRYLVRRYPDLRIDLLTGVSAGAVNAAYLATREGTLLQRVESLATLWAGLRTGDVFRTGTGDLLGHVIRWGLRLVSGGRPRLARTRGLLDTLPLRRLLERELAADGGTLTGIERNIDAGTLQAVAVTTSSYATGQSVTWVQGRDIEAWERPNRRGVRCALTVDHVMASAALPLLFPAVRLDGGWYGDGNVRLAAPLSPAIHLGAERIIIISPRYHRSHEEADMPAVDGYPPPAQVAGVLLNAVFLDLIDQDTHRAECLNRLLAQLPPSRWRGFRPLRLLVLRPSEDLGRLAGDYEARLPRAFRFLERGLGTRETRSNDLLSLLMFQPDYLRRLVELGEEDAGRKEEAIARFVAAR